MATDAINLVTKDHREAEQLFTALKEGRGDRAQLLETLRVELLAHAKTEEAVLYPFLRQALPDLDDQVDEGTDDHHQVEDLLQQLASLAPDDDEVGPLVERIEAAMLEHVDEEENEVLPSLEEAVSEDELTELGESFSQKKTELLAQLRESSGGAREKVGAASGGDLADASKAELQAKAREADIEGRSKMSKEELAQALQDDKD